MSAYEESQLIGYLLLHVTIGLIAGAFFIKYGEKKIARFRSSRGITFRSEPLASLLAITFAFIILYSVGNLFLPNFLWVFVMMLIIMVFFSKVTVYALLVEKPSHRQPEFDEIKKEVFMCDEKKRITIQNFIEMTKDMQRRFDPRLLIEHHALVAMLKPESIERFEECINMPGSEMTKSVMTMEQYWGVCFDAVIQAMLAQAREDYPEADNIWETLISILSMQEHLNNKFDEIMENSVECGASC